MSLKPYLRKGDPPACFLSTRYALAALILDSLSCLTNKISSLDSFRCKGNKCRLLELHNAWLCSMSLWVVIHLPSSSIWNWINALQPILSSIFTWSLWFWPLSCLNLTFQQKTDRCITLLLWIYMYDISSNTEHWSQPYMHSHYRYETLHVIS